MSGQFLRFAATFFFSPSKIVRLVTSASPLLAGWLTLAKLLWMPRLARKTIGGVAVNCVPFSKMMAYGTPNRQIMFRQMKCFAAAAVISDKASASTHLVKYSTATIDRKSVV